MRLTKHYDATSSHGVHGVWSGEGMEAFDMQVFFHCTLQTLSQQSFLSVQDELGTQTLAEDCCCTCFVSLAKPDLDGLSTFCLHGM